MRLTEGIVKEGEALPALTKRVNKIFDKLEKKQARTIAQTETSRAVHSVPRSKPPRHQASSLAGRGWPVPMHARKSAWRSWLDVLRSNWASRSQ